MTVMKLKEIISICAMTPVAWSRTKKKAELDLLLPVLQVIEFLFWLIYI